MSEESLNLTLLIYLISAAGLTVCGITLFRVLNYLDRVAGSLVSSLVLAGFLMISAGMFIDSAFIKNTRVELIKNAEAKPHQQISPLVESDRESFTESHLFTESELDFTLSPVLPTPVKQAPASVPATKLNTIAMVSEKISTPKAKRTEISPQPLQETACYPHGVQPATAPIQTISVNWNSKRLSKYDHLFRHYTNKFFGDGADWRWFKVQAFVESNLNNHAVSKSGAIGVMQILPSTFKQIQKMNRFFRGKSVYNVEWNIAAGIYYNRFLLDEWTVRAAPYKQLQLMFASYNAGFGRVSRSIPGYDLNDDDLLRNTTPLPDETRHYLRKLEHFMQEYRGIAFVSPEHNCETEDRFSPLMIAANAW